MGKREEIGRRIRAAREQKRLSQSELGQMMSRKRSHAAVSDLERGTVRLDVEELAELAVLLERDMHYFLEGNAVYRRGDRWMSSAEQAKTAEALEGFKQFARAQLRSSRGGGQ